MTSPEAYSNPGLKPTPESSGFSKAVTDPRTATVTCGDWGISDRADCRLAPSQWETLLQSNAISHWLGANLESALSELWMDDTRLAPSQWEMPLLCNGVSHWLGASLSEPWMELSGLLLICQAICLMRADSLKAYWSCQSWGWFGVLHIMSVMPDSLILAN